MNLQEQIKSDMVTAMKAKQTVELSFLRVISGELSTNAKKKEKEKLDEQKILRTMSNNAKEMKTMEGDFEVQILDRYIVKIEMLGESQLKTIVGGIVNKNGYSNMQDMGKVMGTLKTHPMTAQIDMKIANGIVRDLLTQ